MKEFQSLLVMPLLTGGISRRQSPLIRKHKILLKFKGKSTASKYDIRISYLNFALSKANYKYVC
jgi:hypothetical protein